ncbi:hypothetical protein L1987_16406 [Smallanthus sonchifolius]|uniref:Uncharacterized protein n=1 Tax=Smallanthus sonchifolius TaxID=185202 RepID=A0ACB9JBR9_9ASTR|nr:hypothetical protein L1987_16406 [Smallanthus sonchifolius]
MFPAHLSSSRYVNGGFSGGGYDCFISLGRGLISDLMAEDESRTETSIDNEEAGSSMKDVNIRDEMNVEDDDHGRWLQLSLGGGHMSHMTTSSHGHRILMTEMSSVDLDLLPGGGSGSSSRQIQQPLPPSPPPAVPPQVFFQVPEFQGHGPTSTAFRQQPHQTAAARNSVPFMTLQQQQHQQQHETNYNYQQLIRPFPANMMIAPLNYPPVSSSSSFSGSSEQHRRPLHLHRRLNVARVVNPPRRPHSGIWFMLQASPNQAKEPFLPQIPKSYLRIKDGRMTVGLLIKYLVNKLELGSESEIEITCKGRQLLSLSTLQHVRDTMWNSPRNDVGFTVVPQSSATINHLMVLNYGRVA